MSRIATHLPGRARDKAQAKAPALKIVSQRVPGLLPAYGGHPLVRYRKPVDRRSRPERWADAVNELLTLQAEYQSWLDALSGGLDASTMTEALRAICELDLSELEAIDPPRGFGRDTD